MLRRRWLFVIGLTAGCSAHLVEEGRYELQVQSARLHCTGATPVCLEQGLAVSCRGGVVDRWVCEYDGALVEDPSTCVLPDMLQPMVWDVRWVGELVSVSVASHGARLEGTASRDQVLRVNGFSPERATWSSAAWHVAFGPTRDSALSAQLTVQLEAPSGAGVGARGCEAQLEAVASRADRR